MAKKLQPVVILVGVVNKIVNARPDDLMVYQVKSLHLPDGEI
jgi:hypothetical protein